MPVHFEECEDIHLNNAPLREVICQVRFPQKLRIANEDPVAFQEAIGGRFPELEIEQPVLIGPLGHESPNVEIQPRIFRFKDRVENYSVSLAPDFFALVSKSYDDWAGFSDHLRFVSEAFQRVYSIDYATRIGLRYVNVLTLENSGARSLQELISIVREELVVLLRLPEIENPYVVKQEIRAKVDDDGDFTLRFGLKDGTQDEYILDFDRYITGEVTIDDLLERCDRYHRAIYCAFRWAIAHGKLEVFRPAW